MSTPKEVLTPFEELVQSDIRNEATDEEMDILRDPENAQDWHDVLLAIIRRIDVQMTNARAERLRLREKYDQDVARKQEWRASALGFRALAEKRLAECKQILREESIEVIRVHELEGAIRHHQEIVADNEDTEAHEADQELWSVVN